MHDIAENINIKDMIYEVRGKEVMLDSDLAKIYGCKNGTKEINQAIKNNPNKFPKRYCFRISELECLTLKSKNLTSKLNKGGSRKGHTVFTEQGIYMLSTILKTKNAVEATLKIMDTFVEMRKFINENKDLFKRMISVENKTEFIQITLFEHDDKIMMLFDRLDHKEQFKNKIFYDGEIYDAYSLIIDIISKAKNQIIVIDNYIDKVALDILSKKDINVKVLLITDKNKNKLNNTDIDKFNKEYPLLDIKYVNTFHDKFIIIDDKDLYHLGSSINYIGSKIFAITKIEDGIIIKNLLSKINV